MPYKDKDRANLWAREYWGKNKERRKEIKKKHTNTHKEEIKKKNHERYARDRDKCLARTKEWAKNNPERRRLLGRLCAARRRMRILQHYSQNIPSCACCGETQLEFLTIDHINNDGAEHRRKISGGGKGAHSYAWIVRNNFPPGFQVLCWNCNCSKGFYGECPHKRRSE